MHHPMEGLLLLSILILVLPGQWLTLEKAGRPGWACFVPIYNFYVLCKISGKPGWWLILLFIPLVNLAVYFLVLHGLSKAFGFGLGMTLLQVFLPWIAYPVLGFGKAEYHQP